jgi:hypothetical protein
MATMTLPLEDKVIKIAENWKSFPESSPQGAIKNDKRKFVQAVCRCEHFIDFLTKKLEDNSCLLKEKELKEKLYLASDTLDTTSDVLENLENSIFVSREKEDFNSVKELELYVKAVKRLEMKLEKFILIASEIEINYFYQREEEAFSRIKKN